MSAYLLNRLIFDLERPEAREAYQADPAAYVGAFDIADAQKRLVLERDWAGLAEAGVSIYVLTRLGALHGMTLVDIGIAMRGTDAEGFARFLREQNAANERFAIVPEVSHG
jgi:protocatechuate 4,5-dioxygenase alpha chain